MLITKNLTIINNQQIIILVDNLSFTLNKNDKFAIIGSEGSGKSTLLKLLKGDIPTYISFTGEIKRPNIISYMEQDIEKSWGSYSTFDYLSNNLNVNEVYEYYEDIFKLCDLFNLSFDNIQNRKIDTFSGGEKVKIGLIKALMIKPDLLLFDEPSNDLDFETLLFLENFLINTEIPLLFISHDQRLLENVSNGIIHLQNTSRKTKTKTYFLKTDYKTYKTNFFNNFQSSMMIARKQRSDYDKKMKRFKEIYQKVETHQNDAVRDPFLAKQLKKKIKSLKSQEKRLNKELENFVEIPEKEESMNLFFDQNQTINHSKLFVSFDNIKLNLPNGKSINNVSLSVKGNDKIIITGTNGIGKTTLIKHIINSLESNNIKYGYISQDYYDILDNNTDPVSFLINNQSKYNEANIRKILGGLEIKKQEMDYLIKDLSDGTKLKVLLLLLISKDIDILILDEPTRNISPINQDELYDLFLNYKGAIIAVSHDRTFIENVFDDIYELNIDGLIKL